MNLEELTASLTPVENWVKRLFYIYATAAMVVLFFHLIRESWTYIEFVPINGQYQNFNPLRRLADGQSIGYDFMSYLGMGPIYFAYPIFKLMGSNPAAGNAAHFITHYLSYIAGSIFLCRLIRLPWVPTLAMTLVTLTAGLKTIAGTVIIVFSALLAPDMTVYGMRVFWPVLAGMIIYLALIKGPLSKPDAKRGYGMAAVVGAVAGVSPLWSNDYGIPTAIALLGYLLLAVCDWRKPLKSLLMLPVFGIVGVIAFGVVLTALTKGHPSYWLDVNYSRIAGDQFWYFGTTASEKFFSPFDVPIESTVKYGLLAMLVMGIRWLFIREEKMAIFLMIGAATFGGAILSTIGGNFDSKYFSGFNRYAVILLPYMVYALVTDLFRLARVIFKLKEPDGMPPMFKLGVMHAGGAMMILFTVWYSFGDYQFVKPGGGVGVPSGPGLINGYHLSWGRQENQSDMIMVPELGGYIGNYFQPMVDMGRRLHDEFERDKVPEKQRIFSTYTTAMDVIAGAMNASRDDYIIHALGDKGRSEYVADFLEAKPRYVTTQREHAISWEHWNQRINWYFYKELYLNYKPVDTAVYLTLWKRRETPLKPDGREIACRIQPNADGMPTRSRVILSDALPEGGVAGDEYWAEVNVDYTLDLQREKFPVFGDRSVIIVHELQSALRGALATRGFGMNPNTGHGTFPVEHRLGMESIVQMEAFPTNRTKFTITKCTAKLYVPTTETRPPDYFGKPGEKVHLKLNGTLAQGQGIWGDVMYSSFLPRSVIIVNSPGVIRALRPGSTIHGPDCIGDRRVVDTDYRAIYIDGPPIPQSCKDVANDLDFTVGTDDGRWMLPFREMMTRQYSGFLACQGNPSQERKPEDAGKSCDQIWGFMP